MHANCLLVHYLARWLNVCKMMMKIILKDLREKIPVNYLFGI